MLLLSRSARALFIGFSLLFAAGSALAQEKPDRPPWAQKRKANSTATATPEPLGAGVAVAVEFALRFCAQGGRFQRRTGKNRAAHSPRPARENRELFAGRQNRAQRQSRHRARQRARRTESPRS